LTLDDALAMAEANGLEAELIDALILRSLDASSYPHNSRCNRRDDTDIRRKFRVENSDSPRALPQVSPHKGDRPLGL
jgi:hypothetical protein